jgi:hypothetical protein
VLSLWLASAIAAGAPAVQWVAPPGCPDAATAQQTIASGLSSASDLRVNAIVSATEAGFAAQVDVSTSAGETRRELQSPECGTLLDAIALIAKAAEAEAEQNAASKQDQVESELVPAAQPQVAATKDTSTPAPRERTPPTRVTPPKPAEPRTLAISPYLRATARIGYGFTPVVDGGGGLALGVQWRRLRVEAFGDVLAPTDRSVPGQIDAAVRVFGWAVGARGCGIVWTNANELVAIPVCGGAEAGQLVGRGVGEGFAAPGEHFAPFVALHAGPALLLRLARWASMYAGLDAHVLVYRPGFKVQNRDEPVFRPTPAGIRFAIGVELHSPRWIGRGRGIR